MGFIFGGNTGETAESIARKRKIAQQMLASNARTPRNVGEGIAAIGRALAARYNNSRADEAEKAGQEAWQEKYGSRFGQIGTEGGDVPSYSMSHIVDALSDDFAPEGFKAMAPTLVQALQPGKDGRTKEERLFEAIQQNPDLGKWLDSRDAARRPSTTVRVTNAGPTGIDYGNPPKDMAWKRNADGSVALDDRGAPIPVPLQNTQAMRDVQAAKEQRQGAYDKATDTIALIDSVLSDDQLGMATGWGSYVPLDIPSLNARVRSKMEQLEGKAFLQAFESLKGGGQITQVEGEKATQAIARLKRAQSEADYREALGELKAIAQRAAERAKQAGTANVGPPPDGIDPADWGAMTPEERQLWQN